MVIFCGKHLLFLVLSFLTQTTREITYMSYLYFENYAPLILQF
jgi:hypothetical protein